MSSNKQKKLDSSYNSEARSYWKISFFGSSIFLTCIRRRTSNVEDNWISIAFPLFSFAPFAFPEKLCRYICTMINDILGKNTPFVPPKKIFPFSTFLAFQIAKLWKWYHDIRSENFMSWILSQTICYSIGLFPLFLSKLPILQERWVS